MDADIAGGRVRTGRPLGVMVASLTITVHRRRRTVRPVGEDLLHSDVPIAFAVPGRPTTVSHHPIAILTSGKAGTGDVRVRELADEIIVAQREEIGEMKRLIADIEQNDIAETEAEANERPVPEFEARP